jgi:hypothetical protein
VIDFGSLNIFAILVVWVINVLIGTLWYSPVGFGKKWSSLSGVDLMKVPKDEATRAIVLVSFSGLVQGIALALVLNSIGAHTVGEGIVAALVIWFGFTAVTTIGNTLYQRQSLKFWFLNASFFLVVMVINSIILSVWK